MEVHPASVQEQFLPPSGGSSMVETAYRLLKRRIIQNELPPGSVIDEREIAHELGMSRTPVREAIIRLRSEDLVEVAPRRGIRVLPLSREAVRELFQIITALEVEATGLLTAMQPTSGQIAPLTDAVAAMQATFAAGDLSVWLDWDERFHRGLLELCGNGRLAAAGLRYRDQVQRAHVIALRLLRSQDESTAAHLELTTCILSGDEARARALHAEQRRIAERNLIEAITRHGLTVL